MKCSTLILALLQKLWVFDYWFDFPWFVAKHVFGNNKNNQSIADKISQSIEEIEIVLSNNNNNNNNNNNDGSSFDPKGCDPAAFEEYCNHMKKSAGNSNSNKMKHLIDCIKNLLLSNNKQDNNNNNNNNNNNSGCGLIGIDVGTATGDAIITVINSLYECGINICNQIECIYGLELEKQNEIIFENNKKTELNILHQNKMKFMLADACKKNEFNISGVPYYDFSIFNSVTHELISYGCKYNKDVFFKTIWPDWLNSIKIGGIVYVRDFMAIDITNNDSSIVIEAKTQCGMDFADRFLNEFNDSKSGRKFIDCKVIHSLNKLIFGDINSLLEFMLSFRWGGDDSLPNPKAEFDGIIAEQFTNYTSNELVHNTCMIDNNDNGCKFEKIHESSYVSKHYLDFWNQHFIFPKWLKTNDYKKCLLKSKNIVIFKRIE